MCYLGQLVIALLVEACLLLLLSISCIIVCGLWLSDLLIKVPNNTPKIRRLGFQCPLELE